MVRFEEGNLELYIMIAGEDDECEYSPYRSHSQGNPFDLFFRSLPYLEISGELGDSRNDFTGIIIFNKHI